MFKGHTPSPVYPDRDEVFAFSYQDKKQTKIVKIVRCKRCNVLYVKEES
jgi:hypothetical protein